MNKITLLGVLFIVAICVVSCKSDDDGYTAVAITAEADSAQMSQDSALEINVLANDQGVPQQGTLTVQGANNGSTVVLDPQNTPDNPSDDIIEYTPEIGYYGSDTFSYTICDQSTTNCATAQVSISVNGISPVAFSLANMPYDTLSEYNFFKGEMTDQDPVFGVLPYKPISTLFSDYALKKRFVWMPEDSRANYINDYTNLDLPVGSILIKTFYYNNVLPAGNTRIIETRLMIKKEEGWVFAEYIWNDDQTEAFLDLSGGFTEISWLQDGEEKSTNYIIPAESACFTCHKSAINSVPIGIKPQNLNADYSFEDGAMNQLQKWANVGYLDGNIPANIETVVDYTDQTQDLTLRARSYFDINCAHCHSDDRHCDYRPMRFAFNESADIANLGVCIDPDTPIEPYTKIVEPGSPDDSVLFFRISTTLENRRMPLLGRTINHEEGIELIRQWISSLGPNCE